MFLPVLLIFLIFCLILLLKLLLPFAPHQGTLLPPGPPGLPIIGSIPFLPKTFRLSRGLHTPKLFYYLAQKYGAVCHLWLGPVPTILISDTKILKKAFKNANMSSRPIMKPFHQFRYGSYVSLYFDVSIRHIGSWNFEIFFSLLKLSKNHPKLNLDLSKNFFEH